MCEKENPTHRGTNNNVQSFINGILILFLILMIGWIAMEPSFDFLGMSERQRIKSNTEIQLASIRATAEANALRQQELQTVIVGQRGGNDLLIFLGIIAVCGTILVALYIIRMTPQTISRERPRIIDKTYIVEDSGQKLLFDHNHKYLGEIKDNE